MLSDEDVREILRMIDDSQLDELRIETAGLSLHVVRGGAAAASELRQDPATAGGTEREPAGSRTVAAPMLGTFYRAEAPGAAPFVELGARVEPDTIVCLIEVMKMMNSVPAGVAGTIIEICAENAVLVEYGQALFRVAAG